MIPDLQCPFEHVDALSFTRKVQKEFNIPKNCVIHVGDEVDSYHGGQWKKDPSVNFSAAQELEITKKKIKEWGKAFPEMKLAISNHGLRWVRKAFDCEIPSQMLIPYKDMIGAPDGWVWKDEWRFNTKFPYRMIHGMGYSGPAAARNAALDARISTIIGHVHTHAGISYIHGNGMEKPIWGFNVGCFIDNEAFAFAYGKYNRQKPILGVGVILDEGKTPIYIPYGSL